eukprot:TRINITY_DN6132_c0_g1_i1.p2 TRINITY_DN6132_c0_g1~~TRINITY_DN6132_c0_g1_i1.p2  ORF type:complete len:367 (+),score=131.42 TRINITY_DN6132_c0_g1_i1:114-1103(+)
MSIFDTNIYIDGKRIVKTLALEYAPNSLVLLRDKITFVLGVMNVALTCFMLGRLPEWLPIYYTYKAVVLIFCRYITYRTKKWHYFLYDFCYFVNALTLLWLWVYPNSQFLFEIIFSFANGPLAWAIIMWRNSMVFHSLDKMTSIFIHLGPPVLMYGMRWSYAAPIYNICGNADNGLPVINGTIEGVSCDISWFDLCSYPFLFYFLWQISYLIKTELVSKKKVEKQDLTTSFRWMLNEKGSIANKIATKYSYGVALLAFIGFQFAYTVATILPVKFMYDNFYVHTFFLVAVLTASLWNGANFYIEVFSKRYQTELANRKLKVEAKKKKTK